MNRKPSAVLDAINSSWGKVKMATLIGAWKKLIPTHLDDFECFKNSVEEELQVWWKWQDNYNRSGA